MLKLSSSRVQHIKDFGPQPQAHNPRFRAQDSRPELQTWGQNERFSAPAPDPGFKAQAPADSGPGPGPRLTIQDSDAVPGARLIIPDFWDGVNRP